MIFGAGEPRLRPLDPVRARRLLGLRSLVDELGLRTMVEQLPTPRMRAHAAECSASVDRSVLGAFTAAGWSASFDRFRVRGAYGWADAADPDHAVAEVDVDGVNVVAVMEGEVPTRWWSSPTTKPCPVLAVPTTTAAAWSP